MSWPAERYWTERKKVQGENEDGVETRGIETKEAFLGSDRDEEQKNPIECPCAHQCKESGCSVNNPPPIHVSIPPNQAFRTSFIKPINQFHLEDPREPSDKGNNHSKMLHTAFVINVRH